MRTLNIIKALWQELALKLQTKHEIGLTKALDISILNELKLNGVVVVPNFWSTEQCTAARQIIDQLLVSHSSYVSQDEEGSDKRLFGANRLEPTLAEFYEDEWIRKMAAAYIGKHVSDGFTLAAKLAYIAGNKGSGGGWHRDSAREPQLKSILYLSDVTSNHGPYQYVPKSQGSKAIVKSMITGKAFHNQHRFTESQYLELKQATKVEEHTYTANQGTLILSDTRGIHRGKPISKDSRYALTNYFWFGKSIDPGMEKLLIPRN